MDRIKESLSKNLSKKSKKPRKYDRRDSELRLLHAASLVFSKLGFDASTTKEIAKKAGVNESLIQRYFKNKLGLFSAILEGFQHELLQELPYSARASLNEEISSFLESRFKFSKDRKTLIRMILLRALVDSAVRNQIKNVHQNGIPHLVKRFEDLQLNGKMTQDINLVHLSQLMGGLAFTLSLMTHILGTISPELNSEMIALVSKLISSKLTPPQHSSILDPH